MYYIRGECPRDDRDRSGTPQSTVDLRRAGGRCGDRCVPLRLGAAGGRGGCGGGEGWLGALRRSPLWITLVVVMATVGAFAAVRSHEPHPEARFALVDIDAYPRLTGISACANPLLPKPGVAAFRSMILSQV